ncbi:hypothetical protein F443_19543 [Phytophthora nicotianae P1569]|uniref:RxLR effector protein n=1 Tax=Phytophthora nicotianae P1569 TaxID=1317065 RepID=V9E6B1_PHYNI|nr:hypothetical protein F443_19543 [Phytophthora nicotianae P1569]
MVRTQRGMRSGLDLFTLRFDLLQPRHMRKYYAILLAVVILFAAGIEAVSTSKTKTTLLVAPQWDRSLTATTKDAPVNHFLRETSTSDEDNEERAFSIPALAKKLGNKIKRLAKYNWWIFTGKKPQDIKDPRYQGYWEFYHNRMTPGGKYS